MLIKLRNAMHRHNYDVSDDELILLIDRLDKNRDGIISQDEVKKINSALLSLYLIFILFFNLKCLNF
jgi:hypothetical protein